MTEREQFEEHIKSAAWYLVLSEAAKDDDEGASVFRMARMAASDAWQASRRAALEECAQVCDRLWTRAGDADECADAIRALSGPTET